MCRSGVGLELASFADRQTGLCTDAALQASEQAAARVQGEAQQTCVRARLSQAGSCSSGTSSRVIHFSAVTETPVNCVLSTMRRSGTRICTSTQVAV